MSLYYPITLTTTGSRVQVGVFFVTKVNLNKNWTGSGIYVRIFSWKTICFSYEKQCFSYEKQYVFRMKNNMFFVRKKCVFTIAEL